ncbi:MAG: helix-turn-helix domain-containing protein [Bacteroidales bacterium]|nr:helix-turn-helix domain-containing protein [Bacteroidales bacterium]
MDTGKKRTNKVSEGVIEVAFSDFPIIEGAAIVQGKVLFSDNVQGGDANSLLKRASSNSANPLKVMMPVIFSCHGGKIDVKINGELYRLRENSILFLKSGNLLESISSSQEAKFALVSVNPAPPKKNRIPTDSVVSFSKILLKNSNPLILDTDKSLGDAFYSLYSSYKQMVSYVEESFVDDLILGFISAFSALMATWTDKRIPDVKVTLDKKSYVFHSFIDNVHKYASKHRDVAFYADKACMTPKYFSDMVSGLTGKPPTYWIKDYVILEAKALLGSGLYSIQQISDKLSFPNPSFFCKYFKSAENMTPGQFMKLGL